MKLLRMKLAAAAFLLAAAPLLSADAAGMDGWYGGMELGVAMSPKLTIKGLDNDFADSKKCDGFPVVALGRDNPDSAPDSPECATDRGNDWASTFDGGTGVLSGLVLGYHFKDFRIEGEYFYRTAGHDQETVPSIGGKIYGEEQDIIPYNKLGDIHSHNIFVNAYYDIPIETKLRPYVGAGAGWSRVNLDYAARFTRISNGTTTVAIETFSNGVFGYQLIAGVDYPLGDRVTIGLKGRWANFGEFKIEGESWDLLRSHASLTGPGGDPILYEVKTDDIRFWGLSLALKYRF